MFSNEYSGVQLNISKDHDMKILNNYILAKLVRSSCEFQIKDIESRRHTSLEGK